MSAAGEQDLPITSTDRKELPIAPRTCPGRQEKQLEPNRLRPYLQSSASGWEQPLPVLLRTASGRMPDPPLNIAEVAERVSSIIIPGVGKID